MARITDINFAHTGKQDGCECDRCGQWITNIWTVKFDDGITAHFGIDCYEKMCKASRLNDYGMKLMKKTLKRIANLEEMRDAQAKKTEENDIAFQNEQAECNKNSYWNGKPYAEYQDWMLNEFFPARIADAKKDLAKFSKVNFKACAE